MKKVTSKSNLFILIIVLFFPFLKVNASNINIEEVVNYMENNNIFSKEEYFELFGRILNGNNEYDIDKFDYSIIQNEENIIIKVTLNDKKQGTIKKETSLNIIDGQINYINHNELNSLESRIDTVLLTQLIYSIGGARGYNEAVLVNWMNQIELNNENEESGIKSKTEKVKYSYQVNDATYDYIIDIPKEYTIDINKLTENIPANEYVQIKEVDKTVSSITLSVYSENHLNDECEIYRLNDEQKYEKIGTTSCNNGEFTDKNLKDNTTYTYQATIKDKIACSDTRNITTIEIPPTGTTICIIGLIILFIIGTIIYIIYNKFNIFRKV